MIRTLYRTQDGQYHTDLTPDHFAGALKDLSGLLWVDFLDTPKDVDAPILLNTFGFHPLAVDDALEETHVPKVDDWYQYLYIVLLAPDFDRKAIDLNLLELDVFLGKNFVVTHHEKPISAVERVWVSCLRSERHLKGGADHLLYALVDELVSQYMPVVDDIDEAIDQLEDRIFGNPEPQTLERIFRLKRVVLDLRRVISPQREVLNRLARDDYAVIDTRDRVYFRDVYDHLVRLNDINESLRDLIGGALDTYLSVINNRMNDVMKTLTAITTLFMPISFLAGFFGMNFFQPTAPLDSWTGLPALIITLLIMIASPLGILWWMRQRKWI
jgi:magnesium transporter